MLEIAQAILSAPAINAALLCVIAALALLWRRDSKKKTEANSNGLPKSWERRVEENFKKAHQMSNEVGILALRVDRAERDLTRVEGKVDSVGPKLAVVEAIMGGLAKMFDEFQETSRENHRDMSDWMAKVLDRLK